MPSPFSKVSLPSNDRFFGRKKKPCCIFQAQPGTGGDDSHIRSSAIVRFMADTDGLAPMEWQYGGDRGPAPPVVLARKDRLPLSSQDFHLICGSDCYTCWERGGRDKL